MGVNKNSAAESMYNVIKDSVDNKQHPDINDYIVYKDDDYNYIVKHDNKTEKFNILSEAIIFIIEKTEGDVSSFTKFKRKFKGLFVKNTDDTCSLYELKEYAKTLVIQERFNKVIELQSKK